MVYKDELKRIERELYERKADLIQELNNLPIGELLCTDQEGYRRYMQRIPAKGNRKKEHRYGVKKQPDVLNGLVRKEYVTDALKRIDQDIRAVELACKRYKPIDEDTIMKSFLTKSRFINHCHHNDESQQHNPGYDCEKKQITDMLHTGRPGF